MQKAIGNLRAEVTAEESECLRRLDAQLILHYMGYNIQNWQDPAAMQPNPSFYALKHAYAPVGVSIDLFDRHFEAGATVTTPVHIMNSTDETARGTLEMIVLPDRAVVLGRHTADRCRLAPDCQRPRPSEHHDDRRAADGAAIVPVTWPAPPVKEGRYLLAAVWRGDGRGRVVSRRVIFAIKKSRTARDIAAQRVTVYDVDGSLKHWAGAQGFTVASALNADVPCRRRAGHPSLAGLRGRDAGAPEMGRARRHARRP